MNADTSSLAKVIGSPSIDGVGMAPGEIELVKQSSIENKEPVSSSPGDRNLKGWLAARCTTDTKKRMVAFWDILGVQVFMFLFTLYALFGEDIRVATAPPSADPIYYSLSCIYMGIFFTEFFVFCFCKPNYPLSFFFFIDFLAAGSLVIDVPWIWDPISGTSGYAIESTASYSLTPTTGEATAAGQRAGRIVRLLRLVRLIQLYRTCQRSKLINVMAGPLAEEDIDELDESLLPSASTGGASLVSDSAMAPDVRNRRLSTFGAASPIAVRRKSLDRHVRLGGAHGLATRRGSKDATAASGGVSGESGKSPSSTSSTHSPAGAAPQVALTGTPNRRVSVSETSVMSVEGDGLRAQRNTKRAQAARIQRLKAKRELRQRLLQRRIAARGQAENSVIGQKISYFTSKIVIVGVLALIFAVPLLTYVENDTTDLSDTALLEFFASSYPQDTFFNLTYTTFVANRGPDLLYLSLNGSSTALINNTAAISALRTSEIQEVVVYQGSNVVAVALVSVKSAQVTAAIYAIGVTLFVMTLLGFASYVFSRDAFRMVIIPIKKMMNWVEVISANPLRKLHQKDVVRENLYEMALLQDTLVRLAKLLQIGFGEAGATILTQSLQAGSLDQSTEGNKMIGIFGFCDIRAFDKMTEGLLEEIMLFVNTIAYQVHQNVVAHFGNVNKNIGNSFLVVWKFTNSTPDGMSLNRAESALSEVTVVPNNRNEAPSRQGARSDSASPPEVALLVSPVGGAAASSSAPQSPLELSPTAASPVAPIASLRTPSLPPVPLPMQTVIRKLAANEDTMEQLEKIAKRSHIELTALRALAAFLTTLIDFSSLPDDWSKKLVEKCPACLPFLMGYGLHVGWAIEGAIGTTHKLDASYLSPNVNMSARLEVATKQYHLVLLMSGTFHSLLPAAVGDRCRIIDCVTVKGSQQPIDLFTFDTSPSALDRARKFRAAEEQKRRTIKKDAAATSTAAAASGAAREESQSGRESASFAMSLRSKPAHFASRLRLKHSLGGPSQSDLQRMSSASGSNSSDELPPGALRTSSVRSGNVSVHSAENSSLAAGSSAGGSSSAGASNSNAAGSSIGGTSIGTLGSGTTVSRAGPSYSSAKKTQIAPIGAGMPTLNTQSTVLEVMEEGNEPAEPVTRAPSSEVPSSAGTQLPAAEVKSSESSSPPSEMGDIGVTSTSTKRGGGAGGGAAGGGAVQSGANFGLMSDRNSIITDRMSIGMASDRTSSIFDIIRDDIDPAALEMSDILHAMGALQDGLPRGWIAVHNKGIQKYLAGDWEEATRLLKDAHEMYPSDEAGKVILDYIASKAIPQDKASATSLTPTPAISAPVDWPGYRALTKK